MMRRRLISSARVERELQVREDVLHLLALEELLPADDPVRRRPARAAPPRRAATARSSGRAPRFRAARLPSSRTGAGPRAPTQLASTSGVGARRRRCTFSPPVAARVKSTLRHLASVRFAMTAFATARIGMQRAVVLLELDDARAGEVPLEVEDVAHVGAAPAVDGLVVVAHGADVPPRRRRGGAASRAGRGSCPGTRRRARRGTRSCQRARTSSSRRARGARPRRRGRRSRTPGTAAAPPGSAGRRRCVISS